MYRRDLTWLSLDVN